MKFNIKHYRGNECFIATSFEGTYYEGTLWNDRGEHRHHMPQAEALEWSEDGAERRTEEVKVATETESGNSTLGGEKAEDTNEVLGNEQGRTGTVASAPSNAGVSRRTSRAR